MPAEPLFDASRAVVFGNKGNDVLSNFLKFAVLASKAVLTAQEGIVMRKVLRLSLLLIGGWWVYTNRLEIGGVVAFISGIGRLNDPWGDLVNYFRDVNVTQIKYRLLVDAVNQLL